MSEVDSSNKKAPDGMDGVHNIKTDYKDELIAHHIMSVADLSYQTLMNRDGSLKGFAEQLLTCVTILSVAYLTPIQLILSVGSECGARWERTVGFVYLVLLIPLLVALILTLVSLAFHKTELLSSPIKQFSHFDEKYEKAQGEGRTITHFEIAKSYCDALGIEYKALEQKHTRMVRLLNVAAVFVIFSVAIAAFGLIALFILIL